jgi:RNAse (barnase) inhibitor barstar
MEELIIDLSNIQSPQELHLKFKTELGFPDFYGMNWDAFWDAITGLVEMPEEVILKNWKALERRMPSDAEILKSLIANFNRESEECEIAIEQIY